MSKLGQIFTAGVSASADMLSAQWLDFLTNTGNGERTKHEKDQWLAKHDSFYAELVELNGPQQSGVALVLRQAQDERISHISGWKTSPANPDRNGCTTRGAACHRGEDLAVEEWRQPERGAVDGPVRASAMSCGGCAVSR